MTAIVLMGVAGSGKTTVGRLLAHKLGWSFHDADDFHPATNIEKMRQGIPLVDEDRWPWLDRLNALLRTGDDAVLGCSALKQTYRARLADGVEDVRWVHLTGSFELIAARLSARKGHYMPPTLLASQFQTLEAPREALGLDVTDTPEALAQRILDKLAVRRRGAQAGPEPTTE